MSQYFPKPYKWCDGNVKVELDLSRYLTNTDLKRSACLDTFNLAVKSNLASLKAEVDKVNIDKLKIVSADLLCNVVDNNVVKKLYMIIYSLRFIPLILVYLF